MKKLLSKLSIFHNNESRNFHTLNSGTDWEVTKGGGYQNHIRPDLLLEHCSLSGANNVWAIFKTIFFGHCHKLSKVLLTFY